MSEPKTVTLVKPIEFGKSTITELTFREPVWGDFFELPTDRAPSHRELAGMASLLCGQPPAVLAKLGVDDMNEVLTVVGGFMPAGLGTPTTPSPS